MGGVLGCGFRGVFRGGLRGVFRGGLRDGGGCGQVEGSDERCWERGEGCMVLPPYKVTQGDAG